MTAVVFKNNASSRLGIPIPAASITITVEAGDGGKFPTPGVDEFFPVIVEDRRTNQFEIMYCTQRVADILTVTRAEEGTAAQDFLLGASVWSTLTAGVLTTYFNYGWSRAQADARFVDVVGDTMTGSLELPGDPILAKHATTKEWVEALVGSVTSLTEAPIDGNPYARRNAAWIQTVTKATYDSDAVVIDDALAAAAADIDALEAAIAATNIQVGLRLTDAPNDGNEYVRKSGAWAVPATAISDAPNDGTRYVRLSGAWSLLSAAVLLNEIKTVDGAGSGLDADLFDGQTSGQFATLSNPVFTGNPRGPTPTAGDNDTSLATTAFVQTAIAGTAPIISPAFTGNPTAPTPTAGDNDTSLATTAFVTAADAVVSAVVATKAPLASPVFTGNPTAPTPTAGDSDTSLATTAFVAAAVATVAVPPGAVWDYAGLSAPPLWLLCFGQEISRTTYAALFAVIGTTYGVGNGSSTFNIPDARGRVIAGQDDMGGASADRLTGLSGGVDGDVIGASGGLQTHTLTEAQLAVHNHFTTTSQPYVSGTPVIGNTGTTLGGIEASASPKQSFNAGSGQAHNNVQPTLILNKIIYAGV